MKLPLSTPEPPLRCSSPAFFYLFPEHHSLSISHAPSSTVPRLATACCNHIFFFFFFVPLFFHSSKLNKLRLINFEKPSHRHLRTSSSITRTASTAPPHPHRNSLSERCCCFPNMNDEVVYALGDEVVYEIGDELVYQLGDELVLMK